MKKELFISTLIACTVGLSSQAGTYTAPSVQQTTEANNVNESEVYTVKCKDPVSGEIVYKTVTMLPRSSYGSDDVFKEEIKKRGEEVCGTGCYLGFIELGGSLLPVPGPETGL